VSSPAAHAARMLLNQLAVSGSARGSFIGCNDFAYGKACQATMEPQWWRVLHRNRPVLATGASPMKHNLLAKRPPHRSGMLIDSSTVPGQLHHGHCSTKAYSKGKATHRSGMLIASSTVHGRLTWPEMLNSLVPLLLGRPRLEYHCRGNQMCEEKGNVDACIE